MNDPTLTAQISAIARFMADSRLGLTEDQAAVLLVLAQKDGAEGLANEVSRPEAVLERIAEIDEEHNKS